MAEDKAIYKEVVITKIIEETSDAKTFELTPLNGWEPVYNEGQFITLIFKRHDVEYRRSYSFSSSPALNEKMRITVKRVENGEYSRYMLDHARVGDVLTTSGIAGFFRLPDSLENISGFCFMAAGSGITPVYSLLKNILHNTALPVVLIYSNKSELDTIFYQSLLQLEEQYPERLKINFLFSNIRDVYKSRLSNWLLIQLLAQYNLDKAATMFYTCGPFLYMQMIMITLLTEGVPAAHIKKENFSTLPLIHKPQPPDTSAHDVEVHINGQVHHLTVQYPDSIISTAKKKHIQLPYSCEAGRCGSCTATCIKGDVWMAYNEVLTEDEIEKGRVLTCQGYPVNGDVIIDFGGTL